MVRAGEAIDASARPQPRISTRRRIHSTAPRHYVFDEAIVAFNQALKPAVLADGTYFLNYNGVTLSR